MARRQSGIVIVGTLQGTVPIAVELVPSETGTTVIGHTHGLLWGGLDDRIRACS